VSSEPFALPDILAECSPPAPGELGRVSCANAEARVRAAFLGRLCGCMLGKPVEGSADLAGMRGAGTRTGQWPLRFYVTEAFLDALGGRHPSWTETVRERIRCVAPDDDINYTLLAMAVLEKKGVDFTRDDLRRAWLANLAPAWTWGPERAFLSRAALATRGGADEAAVVDEQTLAAWVAECNAAPEHCGAAIRADAYGYACMGDPARAAVLAWRDAGMTHRGAGIYGSMFIAAAIAATPVSAAVPEAADRLAVFDIALRCVPRGSMFHQVMTESLSIVRAASDWLDAYEKIHAAWGRYGFCQVYQELATVMNSVRFARDVGDGICMQVSQGLDTDSFGATTGSLLGAWFGPGHLDARWTRPFRNTIHCTLAEFHEQDLSRVVARVSRLPRLTLGVGTVPPR
jgi:ADP-ribosylglycohydrolase